MWNIPCESRGLSDRRQSSPPVSWEFSECTRHLYHIPHRDVATQLVADIFCQSAKEAYGYISVAYLRRFIVTAALQMGSGQSDENILDKNSPFGRGLLPGIKP
jgi:hypothetical protein